MKKIFQMCLVIGLSFLGLSAQAQQSMLWKVSGNGLEEPSYLFGTIHFLCGENMLDRPAWKALGNTKKVFLELDMDDPSLQTKLQKLMIDPVIKPKYVALDERFYQQIDEFLQKHYSARLDQMSVMKPFALMSMILIKSIDCDNFTSMEELVMKAAKSNYVPVEGLETAEFQLSLFDKVPFDDQMDWIRELLENDYAYEYKNMLDAYQSGDLEELYDMVLESPGIDNYMDMLIIDRNLNWIPVMKREMGRQPTFFAVGAGHLAGSQGVIELLGDEGYEVEAVLE